MEWILSIAGFFGLMSIADYLDEKWKKFFNKFLQKKEIEKNLEEKPTIKKRTIIKSQKFKQVKKHQKSTNKISYEENILMTLNIQYIYHMTHIDNLQNILNYGLLPHNNRAVNNKIDNPEVNDRRNFREPIYQKNIHNYVPFYFNPKNAMLYVNKEKQNVLIILVFNNNLIYQQGTLFTDGNVSANGTKFYNNINDLYKLNWKCLKSQYWNDFEDGKRLMMSEILVPNKVNITKLKKIYCTNDHIKGYIDSLLINYPNIKVEVNSKIFF